jgi:hypothetical protein
MPLLVFNDHTYRRAWIFHVVKALDNRSVRLPDPVKMKAQIIAFKNRFTIQPDRQVFLVAHNLSIRSLKFYANSF